MFYIYELYQLKNDVTMTKKWDEFDQVVIDAAISQWRARLAACVEAEGGHFEHTL